MTPKNFQKNLPPKNFHYLKGYGKLYAISKEGEVWGQRWNRILKQNLNQGYWAMTLYNENGKAHYRKTHRLLALQFLPNPKNKPVINHIDGNPSNNRLSNLEWATTSENERHAHDMGLKLRPGRTLEMRGITWYKSRKRWICLSSYRGRRRKYLKSFSKLEDAIQFMKNHQ